MLPSQPQRIARFIPRLLGEAPAKLWAQRFAVTCARSARRDVARRRGFKDQPNSPLNFEPSNGCQLGPRDIVARATGVSPNSPAEQHVACGARRAILVRGLAFGPSGVLIRRPRVISS
jgi:hypothetical protein